MAHAEPRRQGMAGFLLVWAGQVVSTLGSNLTGFALAVWVYQRTGSATRFALIAFATMVPGLLLTPLAGVLVDRWDRRHALILSDAGAGCATLGLVVLIRQGHLEIWEIYLLMAAVSAFGALRWPAFSAATTLMVPSRHLGRASGMTQLGEAAAELTAPALAGVLLGVVGRQGIVLVDFVTYLAAIGTLLLVRMPSPPASAAGTAARGSLLREARFGWLFIRRRPGLLALLLVFAATGIGLGMVQVLLSPMVLAFTSAAVLGRVLTGAGCGMVAGSLVMSAWEGPRRRVAWILGLLALQGTVLLFGGWRPSAPLIALAAAVYLFATPVMNACSQVLWQSKVPPDVQGKVFAVRRLVASSTLPLAYLAAGPLADRVFEPLLAPGGPLAGNVGRLIGVGKGRGIALLFIVLGAFVLAIVAAAWRYPRLRGLESELPDTLPAALPDALPGTAAPSPALLPTVSL